MPHIVQSESLAVTRIRPETGWSALDLRQLVRFRDLIWSLALRDVKLRYRQTALGVAWVLLQPVLAAGIFSVVFGGIANLSTDGVPYFLFSFAGMLAWNAFNSTLAKASVSLVGNAHLVSKIYFPRLVLPISTLVSTLVDFLIGLVFLAVLLVWYGIKLGPPILLLPVWVVLAMSLATGFGLVAAALTVSYRDVQYILPVMIPFLLYASPVGYAVSAVPARLRPMLLFNPLSGLLEGFRWSVFGHAPPSWTAIVYSVLTALLVLVFGVIFFRNMERRFADVI